MHTHKQLKNTSKKKKTEEAKKLIPGDDGLRIPNGIVTQERCIHTHTNTNTQTYAHDKYIAV